jgi:hypothetical protein
MGSVSHQQQVIRAPTLNKHITKMRYGENSKKCVKSETNYRTRSSAPVPTAADVVLRSINKVFATKRALDNLALLGVGDQLSGSAD